MCKLKKCTSCKKRLNLENFVSDSTRGDGLCAKCKECNNSRSKKYYESHKTKILKRNMDYDRTIKLFKRYGITPKQWEEIYTRQNGCCAICGIHQSQLRVRLCVDHNHFTGEVRGLLCSSCNTKLAVVEDKEYVSAAEEYLV